MSSVRARNRSEIVAVPVSSMTVGTSLEMYLLMVVYSQRMGSCETESRARVIHDLDSFGGAAAVGLDIGGNRITYDVEAKKLNGADLKPVDGRISIRVLVDRPMLEIIGNQGRVFITSGRRKKGEVSAVTAFADGGKARLLGLEVHELESIWKKRGSR